MSMKGMSLVGLDVHARQTHAAVLVPDTGELRVVVLRIAPVEVVEFLAGLTPLPAVYEAGPTGFGLARAVDVVLERELRGVDSDDEQPVVSVGLRPRAHVRLLAQPVDARPRPEVHEHDLAAQLGGAERLGVEPLCRPAELGDALALEDAHLPKRPERRS